MIRCPNCHHKIELSGAKPGHYKPACPECKRRFDLLIPKDPAEPPRVTKLDPANETAGPGVTRAPTVAARDPGATRAPTVAARDPGATRAPTAAPSHDVAATIAPPRPAAPRVDHPTAPARAHPQPVVGASRVAETLAPESAVAADASPFDRADFHTAGLGDSNLIYDDLTGDISGYDIVKKLGQGGMGSVYLARQQSLDRHVALKTLSPTLAMDPQFVARFTREAYAAAQLNHHNVVQIHDIGQDRGTNFYSMELVEGSNLASVVEKEGRLDPMTAVGYVLQAARGLKFAHQRGLIHRDVKPENLLLNGDGIVKVADLGLVKRAGTNDTISGAKPQATHHNGGGGGGAHATQLNTSMGTPAYMAPEQARDAGKVDQRADIYSLGCTLYDLITGRPPFSGKSAIEVMTKHQREPITPPDKIVAGLPKRLTEIVAKMTAKDPAGRYQQMEEVVRDLEDFLGVEHGGGVRGSQEAIKVVTTSVEQFNAANFAKFRGRLIVAFYGLCLLSLVVGVVAFKLPVIVGTVLFAVVATLAYQVTIGLRERTAVFLKTRQWLLGASLSDWLTTIAAVGLTIALLTVLGQLFTAVVVTLAASILAVLFHFFVDHVVKVEHEAPLRATETLIRDMRAKGMDEEGIRGFIAKFSGHRWEAFYEALFGYDAKIEARRLYGKGERGQDRKREGIWRDLLLAWINRRIEDRKQLKERKLLAKLEQKALEAKGTQSNVAARQARQTAAAVVERASALRSRDAATLAPTPRGDRQPTIYQRPAWLDADETQINESLEDYEKSSYLKRRFGGPLDVLLGRRVRFLLAALVLLGAARWVQINGGTRVGEQFREITSSKIESIQDVKGKLTGAVVAVKKDVEAGDEGMKPLVVPGVPAVVTDAVGSWYGVLAGLLLLLSVPIYGHLMSFCVIAGAGLTLFGSRIGIPGIGNLPAWIMALAGSGLALLAMFFLRKSED